MRSRLTYHANFLFPERHDETLFSTSFGFAPNKHIQLWTTSRCVIPTLVPHTHIHTLSEETAKPALVDTLLELSKMIHCTKFVFGLVLALSLSHTVFGCIDDYNCGSGQTCCSDGECGYGCSYVSDDDTSLSAGIVVLIIVLVVVKVAFWVSCCYCRYRRRVVYIAPAYSQFPNAQTTVVVSQNHTTSTAYPTPLAPPSHPQVPQQQPGFTYPQHTVPVQDNIAAMNPNFAPPPAYSTTVQSRAV